jgi:hypothetical protein
MGTRKIVALRPARKEGAKSRPKTRTLADVRLTHTIGSRTTSYSGETIARLIEATQHLHDRTARGDDLDFIDAYAIAVELQGLADVLCCVSENEQFPIERALPYLGDQLRRISHRVAALAPRGGNNAPDWYQVEVKR